MSEGGSYGAVVRWHRGQFCDVGSHEVTAVPNQAGNMTGGKAELLSVCACREGRSLLRGDSYPVRKKRDTLKAENSSGTAWAAHGNLG